MYTILSRIYRRFAAPTVALLLVLVIGTFGYLRIGGADATFIDALYMTFITVATIGFGEIIDMNGKPGARVFTMFISVAGIGVTTYILSTLTAFILEGEMNQALRRRKMQKRIASSSDHYILCGIGRVGSNVAAELITTKRPFVVVDISGPQLSQFLERHPETLHILGDASDDEALIRAGVERAAGVFAVTGDDSKNLVVTLSAKQMNPACRVVARCHETSYFSKMQKVGADAIVSPDFTGGMRIVSSMVRPQVVSFLDQMLRSDNNVRVEEVTVPDGCTATLENFAPASRNYIVLALKRGGETEFNPPQGKPLQAGDIIVVMATPEGRRGLEKKFTVRDA